MKPRIVFIHGNQVTHWSGCWCGWLKAELDKLGFPSFFETFPDSIIARSKYWLPFLENHVKAGKNDLLLGWSSGATAAMRYAEDHKVLGSILVSPTYTDLGDELEKQSGYFDQSWDWQAIKGNQEKIAVFYSDNDPWIPETDFEFIAKQLMPEAIKLPGKKHFVEQKTFPELLDYIQRTYSA